MHAHLQLRALTAFCLSYLPRHAAFAWHVFAAYIQTHALGSSLLHVILQLQQADEVERGERACGGCGGLE
eukprot:1482054-Lingulodinium_polyedra.AAC.1